MSWIDSILSSSAIVWIMIGFGILHLYLKKTKKTLPEFLKEVGEVVKGWSSDD